jgi:hypothetical protein
MHGVSILVSRTEKGSRSTFSPISPHPVFQSLVFSQLPSNKGGAGGIRRVIF